MKVVIENVKPLLMNPEDKFNDLLKFGLSVNQALIEIMEDAILEKKIEELYPDYYGDSYVELEDDKWEVVLNKFED
jgi:hypothetical protein